MRWKKFNDDTNTAGRGGAPTLLFILGCCLLGCQPKVVVPPAPVPPPAPALLEHTFGRVHVESAAGASLSYKSIELRINEISDAKTPIDYVLLQDGSRIPNLSGLRPSQKIIAPSSMVGSIKKQGFTSVKDLPTGRMIQLTKDSAFLFVLAAETKTPAGASLNSYLLEFDNGRNVLLIAPGARADDLRPFLYALRDEGKVVDLGVVPAGSTGDVAELIGLFQPQEAAVAGSISAKDKSDLAAQLRDQFFQGALIFSEPGGTIDF